MKQKTFSHHIWDITKIFLAVLFLSFVIYKTDINQIRLLKDVIDWGWFTLLFITFVILTLVKAYQYYALIGHDIKYKDLLRIVIWQNAISIFIASGAGIVSYMTMLKAEKNIKLTRSGVIFAVTKIGDLLAICFYLSLSSAQVWNQIRPLRWVTLLLLSGMLLGIGILLVTIFWRERFVGSVTRVLQMVRIDHFPIIKKGLSVLHLLAQTERGPIIAMLQTGAMTSLGYITISMVFAVITMRVFNIQMGRWVIIYVGTLIQLVSYIPIQVFGGLGVSEATSVYLYGVFSFDQGEMSAVMLGVRAIFYLMNLFILLYLPLSTFLEKNTNRQNNPG